jgi:hypothetical protein
LNPRLRMTGAGEEGLGRCQPLIRRTGHLAIRTRRSALVSLIQSGLAVASGTGVQAYRQVMVRPAVLPRWRAVGAVRFAKQTDATFDQEVTGADGPMLAEFFTTWCRTCRRLAPVL